MEAFTSAPKTTWLQKSHYPLLQAWSHRGVQKLGALHCLLLLQLVVVLWGFFYCLQAQYLMYVLLQAVTVKLPVTGAWSNDEYIGLTCSQEL